MFLFMPTPVQGGDTSMHDHSYRIDNSYNRKNQNMINFRVMRISLALLASTSMAACLGSNNGNGGGGGGGGTSGGPTASSSYQTEFDRVTGVAPTSDMPTTIQATYSGQLQADVTDASQVVGEVVADLNLDVDWVDGQTSNPFSGGASNFQGRLAAGEFEAINGTLSVDPAFPGTIARTIFPSSNIGGVSVPEVQTGAMSVTLSGQLSQGENTADTTILLGGNFLGSGASAATGAVSGGFSDATAPGPSIFDGGIGGTYYLERQ